MNGTNLFRLVVTFLVVLYAASQLIPVKDTPFEEFALNRVTAAIGEDGSVIRDQAANRAKFEELMERARTRVAESQGQQPNPFPTTFVALQRIANEESIDLTQFFSDLRIADIRNIRRKNNIVMTELLKQSKGSIRLGLDLNGGVAITFEVDESGLSDDSFFRQRQLEDARSVIASRVDGLGVAEPVVRVRGNNQIEVQMPGINTRDNPDIAGTIGAPARLEFRLVHRTADPRTSAETPIGYQRIVQEIENPRTGDIEEMPLFVQRIPVMRGDIIQQARPQITQTGGFEVGMDFTAEGGRLFAEVTGRIAEENNPASGSIGRLAIILDGRLMSAPTVQQRIDGRSARITGNFDQREAFELANALNNPLAVELRVAELFEVSPTLAEDARDASIRAALLGSGLVVLFMVIYYGIAGIIATFLIVLNVGIVLGILAGFGATITLPGVAALVLTVGMAVDSMILIYERMREELNVGKSLKNAVSAGYDKAFSTIVDANVTTLITASILIWLGTGPVKGFGITLAIGICTTIFCALVASRFIIDFVTDYGIMKNPFRFQLYKGENVQFLTYAKRAFTASWIVVALGIVAFILHFDRAFGIDFRGGDELSVRFEQRLTSEQVRTAAASNLFVDRDGDQVAFGEVNVFFQTPLGQDIENMLIQTEIGKGRQLFEVLNREFPEAGLELLGETQIGAAVGREVTQSAILSVIVALLAILLYVAIRFEFGFGLGAIVATLHDVLMTVGLFIAFGEFFGIGSGQFTAPMIAAILMTVGYSINDTIVVFDRIREELEMNPQMTLRDVIHLSINKVLNRTILTSLTTLLATFALFIFGAGIILDFSLVFIIGILVGTFSSIFIASPIFFWYHKGDRRKVEKGEILPTYDWAAAPEPKKDAKAES
ncbi:MAG: protein translocase subunit SecD [Verrucomicrobia bacterium]|nr:protein translocase subunit SecD [Verrucomicrobiota bacterium]